MTLSHNLQGAYDWFAGAPLHIVEIILIALLLQKIGARAITRGLNRIAGADFIPGIRHGLHRQRERTKTAGTVMRSAMIATIWLIALSMILSEFGLNLGPVVASAGVIGVALGLGAQTIVRDVISGIFMLIEDQCGVGDEISVMEVTGIVESVGLRITTVRSIDGTLWYLRNGEILKVGNRSQPKQN